MPTILFWKSFLNYHPYPKAFFLALYIFCFEFWDNFILLFQWVYSSAMLAAIQFVFKVLFFSCNTYIFYG